MMKLHSSITDEVLVDACERREFGLDNPGFCITCGDEQGGCEPDATMNICEECRTPTVYAPEELLLMTV